MTLHSKLLEIISCLEGFILTKRPSLDWLSGSRCSSLPLRTT